MDTHQRIVGQERLTSIFGYWPSFHDAEVVWCHLDRRPTALGPGPTFEAMIHAFEMTSETDARGYFILRHHTLVHLRFADIDDFKCEIFNHQNSLFEVSITDYRGPQSGELWFDVVLESAYGGEASAKFRCRQAEVVSVTSCDAKGEAVPS